MISNHADIPSSFCRTWLQVLLALAVVGLLTGCASTDESAGGAAGAASLDQQRARMATLSREGFTIETVDLNGDEAPDQWVYRTPEGVVHRIERDLNFDGQIDMWQYFDEHDAVVEEEMDLDLDGKVDMVVFYNDGIVARKLLSLGFDGRFAIQKFYDGGGNLLRIERDDTGKGQPNVWEYYENGRRVRIGWDTTGDGVPDTFDQL